MYGPADLVLHCGKQTLDLAQAQVMGIVNVTPDSFSDGGRYNNLEVALQHALQMHALGASIIEIGRAHV